MSECERCKSFAINPHMHGRNGTDLDLCDVCYWRERGEYWRAQAETLAGLVREGMDRHSDPRSSQYDVCDMQPCEWCESAAAAIKGIDTGGRARIVRG